jgi:hypothetical protein
MTIAVFPPGVVPNKEAQAIQNLVPGAEMLGYGFDIFGAYSFDNAIQPLFKLGATSLWSAPSGTVYQLPANVTSPGGSSSTASASTFATSSAFNSYFQSSASVSGSIGAFSASFSGTYATDQQNENSYSWALVEADFIAWHVGINYGQQILRDEIKSDPDWSSLPSTFEPSNQTNVLAFFRFFEKFGTHFISTVTTGGTLYYYFAVSDSASYTSTDISVSATAEYQGLISSTSASASAHWGNCASNWTSNRQSHSMTVPATTGVINWVNPPSGTYDSGNNFSQWQTAVVANPSRCKFSLTPIWALFSGAQWQALQQAFAAYGSNRVSLQAKWSGTAVILVNGNPIIPPGGYPNIQSPFWQVVILNRKTLAVEMNKVYMFDFSNPNWPDNTFATMAADLKPYTGSSNSILVTATSNMDEACNPNAEMYAVFKSFGAGPLLDTWMGEPNHACASGWGTAVYALVGAGASASGCEGFGSNYPGSPSGKTVAINALLLPLDGSFTPISYQP